MFATTEEGIKQVLGQFSKRQRIGLRQEFGSRPICGIRYDEDSDYVVVQFGNKEHPIVQHSFFIRKTGKIVYKQTQECFQAWSGRWTKK